MTISPIAERNPQKRRRSVRRLRRERPFRRRVRGPSFNRLIPNLMTMLGLCAGMSSIRFALERDFSAAAICLVVAAIIDGLDGRIARLLHGTSRFGAEFDSLSDFVCFGVAPSLLMYLWSLQGLGGRYGFVLCILYTVCMALRLARFNATLSDNDKPSFPPGFFRGVPAPAGAGIALFPIFLGLKAQKSGLYGLEIFAQSPFFTSGFLVLSAALSVSTLPVWSFKNFKIPAPLVLSVMIGTLLYVGFLIADPWAALALAGLLYLCLLPVSRRSYHRLKAQTDAISEDVEEA